ncbi:hypothetical protein G7Y89_g4084 [Cudoniella acicularis]|uniref:Rhodopsin domain-containing protein n=1 Tax=Cudoniella acicularis TaxID=354080 RepID=A0A8H4RQ55_9HELO|nr:hypothetical protein G7Y89_g4084 [Cudoniella acicularis]
MPKFRTSVGTIGGYDFSSRVILLGSQVQRLCVGDRAEESLLLKIPESMRFEEAAALGVSLSTVGMALYQSLGLRFPSVIAESRPDEYFLVYGGSTSCGTMAIQLLKLSLTKKRQAPLDVLLESISESKLAITPSRRYLMTFERSIGLSHRRCQTMKSSNSFYLLYRYVGGMKFVYTLETELQAASNCTVLELSVNVNHQLVLIAITALVVSLATISVAFRFWSRYISRVSFGLDDISILGALLISFGKDVGTGLLLSHGLGKHQIILNNEQLLAILKSFFASSILFFVAIAITKISILFFYLRIFWCDKKVVLGCNVGFTLIFLWLIANFLLAFLNCRPVEYYWDKTIPGGTCPISTLTVDFSTTGSNIFTDIFIMALPIPALIKLKIGRNQKIGISLTFLLGCFVCIAAVVRIPFILQTSPYDFTFDNVQFAIWVDIELNLGIVCACLPTMLPGLRLLSPTLRSWIYKISSLGSRRSPASGSTVLENGKDSTENFVANSSDVILKHVEIRQHRSAPSTDHSIPTVATHDSWSQPSGQRNLRPLQSSGRKDIDSETPRGDHSESFTVWDQ